jgi:2-methylisocitrate lyase-like PEP mutase family enzyme
MQLLQLRSIEPNELAMVADIHNKAILVFTGVTIVLFPHSSLRAIMAWISAAYVTLRERNHISGKCATPLHSALSTLTLTIADAFRHKVRVRRLVRRITSAYGR